MHGQRRSGSARTNETRLLAAELPNFFDAKLSVRNDMDCKGNRTCAVTCRALCQDAVEQAQRRDTAYESAMERIIKSRSTNLA